MTTPVKMGTPFAVPSEILDGLPPLAGWVDVGNTTRDEEVTWPALRDGIITREEFRSKWGLDRMSQPSYQVTLGRATGGTYTTRTPDEETGETIVRTWNYNQSMTEQPVSEERLPMVQMDTISPHAQKFQRPGAKRVSFRGGYMNEAHDHVDLLQRYKEVVGRTKIDTLVGMGISGTLAVVNLARDLDLNYLIVRKDGESSHSSEKAEGVLGKNWIFVDDLVASGRTFARVWDAMERMVPEGFQTQFKGLFLYESPRFVGTGDRYQRSSIDDWLYRGGSEEYRRQFRNRRTLREDSASW
jgi:hypothetical protein